MKKIGLFLISVITLFSACNNAKDTVTMTVASEKRMAMGVAPMEVLLVKEGDATDWSFFYSNIEGFNYEPGYEYVLEVKKEAIENPTPADASSIKYTLVKEVSKVEKTSENMLEDVVKQPKFSWTGKVLEIQDFTLGRGAAEGQFSAKVVKLEVTAVNMTDTLFNQGDTIHAELVAESSVLPEVNKEYTFHSESNHPAHALGIYLLETEIENIAE